jgi:hypothetical protein
VVASFHHRLSSPRGEQLCCVQHLDIGGAQRGVPRLEALTMEQACRVTAGSHIPGTEPSLTVTSGHAGAEVCIQEEHGGYGRIWSDTLSTRFGTVRLQRSNGLLLIQRDRPAPEAPGYSVIRRATRRLRARFASRAQMRSHYAIRLSDAATQFEGAIGDIAYCSGSEG